MPQYLLTTHQTLNTLGDVTIRVYQPGAFTQFAFEWRQDLRTITFYYVHRSTGNWEEIGSFKFKLRDVEPSDENSEQWYEYKNEQEEDRI